MNGVRQKKNYSVITNFKEIWGRGCWEGRNADKLVSEKKHQRGILTTFGWLFTMLHNLKGSYTYLAKETKKKPPLFVELA